MSVDRRHFLLAGSTLAGGGLTSAAYAATATGAARSVAEFGVVPNTDKDQTDALQKAVEELSRAGQPIVLPGGEYRATKLILPNWCSLIGVPGQTLLNVGEVTTRPGNDTLGLFVLFGLSFQSKSSAVQIVAPGGSPVRIANCHFNGGGKTALQLDGCSGTLETSYFQHYSADAIAAVRSNLTISGCHFSDCGRGISSSSSRSAIVAQNQFDRCGTAVATDGTALISGNIVKDAKEFGLKLGRGDGSGRVVAQGNLVENCRVGIGVTASGDDIFASLNLIHGAKDGAIRAFDGEKLVGRDLARESAEMYLNLTVAGNVAR
jgi:hypothetical protein